MNRDATKDSESFDASQVVEILRDIEERLAIAWVEGDHSFIEQILADDWSVTDLTGRVLKKAEVLEEAFGSKGRQVVSMRIDDIAQSIKFLVENNGQHIQSSPSSLWCEMMFL